MSCGAPVQTSELPPNVNTEVQAVLQGKVLTGGTPVAGAFVRLLDGDGEFTAEVVSSPDGDFRFYTAPGAWTVRALSRLGNGLTRLTTDTGVFSVDVHIS
jgi:hypothetical protein